MPPAGDLHRFLSERLPEYMVPAAFVEIAELPRTAHGKVDRKLLPAADLAAATTAAAPVEPRTPAETALAEIWSELLGLDRVGVRDDFFALGGHSLLAVRLMSRIRARFGRDLPISALFQRPTIERLAEALETGAPGEIPREPRHPLVPIRPEGEGAPLFFVHPVGGNVLGYADLARHLGPGRPFYGLQSPDPDAIPATLESLATLYLTEARKAHPGGPWRLGGWSMGALIAWEMARQLQDQRESVELLALVDPSPADLIRPDQTEAELALSFARDLAGLGGLVLPEAEAALKDIPDAEVLPRLYEGVRQAGLVPGDVALADIRALFETFKANTRLLAAYRPGRVRGNARLITATASADFGAAPSWERLLDGRLDVHVLEGDHYSILREPGVRLLTALLL
jgi:thioesterase domain-containing protein/acyl carrier protein